MARIPEAELASVGLPGNTMAEKSNYTGQAVSQVGQKVGGQLMEWAEKKEKRDSTAKITGAANEFHEWNLIEKQQIEQNKLGLDAENVYEEYKTKADAKREEILQKAGLGGGWAEVGRDKLNTIKNSYADNHIAWQAKQVNLGRQEVVSKAVNVSGSMISDDTSRVNEAFAYIEQTVADTIPVNPETGEQTKAAKNFITAGKADALKNGVIAAIKKPDGYLVASGLLETHKDLFEEDPKTYAILKEAVDSEAVPFFGKQEGLEAAGSLDPRGRDDRTYTAAMTELDKKPIASVNGIDGEAVKAEAQKVLKTRWELLSKADTARQAGSLERYTKEIFVDADKKWMARVDDYRQQIRQDTSLDNENKARVLGWIDASVKGEGADKSLKDDPAYKVRFQRLIDDINSGRVEDREQLEKLFMGAQLTGQDFDEARGALRRYDGIKTSLDGNISALKGEFADMFDGKNAVGTRTELAKRATAYLEDTGKSPGLDFYKKELESMKTSGWWWDRKPKNTTYLEDTEKFYLDRGAEYAVRLGKGQWQVRVKGEDYIYVDGVPYKKTGGSSNGVK